MSSRPGILFRFDLLDAIEQLAPADAGRLFVGALRYGEYGEVPTFQNSLLSIVWALVKPSIDADGEHYAEKVLQKRYAAYVREAKKAEQNPMSFDSWKSSADITRRQPISADIQSNNNINPIQEQVQVQGMAALPPPPARDSRNLIFLDDEQYNVLVADLGEPELKRCIDYLSEYCSTHNKKYHDWPTMIRKASREGWGKPAGVPKATAPGTDLQPSADRIRQNNAWLKQFLAEQEAKEGEKVDGR